MGAASRAITVGALAGVLVGACARSPDGPAPLEVWAVDDPDAELEAPDGEPLPSDAVVTRPMAGTKVAVFGTADGVALVGRVFGQGRLSGVVFMHSAERDMRAWFPLAQRVMDDGYAALPFDLRGHNQSEGSPAPLLYAEDALAAVRYLAATGTSRVMLVGAGTGAWAALEAASRSDEVAAVAAVGPEPATEGQDRWPSAPTLRVPVLVVGVGTGHSVDLAQNVSDAELHRLGTRTDAATDPAVERLLLEFMSEEMPP